MKKEINELKNIHKGQDIWVIASGSSMDFVDPSFFEGKITIGVNEVYCKFKCDYLVRKESWEMQEAYETGSKLIMSEYNNASCRDLNEIDGECWFFRHMRNRRGMIDFSIIGTDMIIVSYSTITSAIHVAAYMGAKNIILCGHDCGLLDGKSNISGYRKSELPPDKFDWYSGWLKGIENQTILVREMLKKAYGCNIYSLNPFVSLNLEGHKFE